MNFNALSRHARLIVRGELLLLQAKLAFAMKRSAYVGFALLFAGIGLVFINMGLFAWLLPIWGPVWTPAGLGILNLGLAATALAVALFLKPGPEMALAEEIRNMAADSMEAEVRSAPLMGAMGGGSMAGLVLPAVTTIIGALAKRRKDKI